MRLKWISVGNEMFYRPFLPTNTLLLVKCVSFVRVFLFHVGSYSRSIAKEKKHRHTTRNVNYYFCDGAKERCGISCFCWSWDDTVSVLKTNQRFHDQCSHSARGRNGMEWYGVCYAVEQAHCLIPCLNSFSLHSYLAKYSRWVNFTLLYFNLHSIRLVRWLSFVFLTPKWISHTHAISSVNSLLRSFHSLTH